MGTPAVEDMAALAARVAAIEGGGLARVAALEGVVAPMQTAVQAMEGIVNPLAGFAHRDAQRASRNQTPARHDAGVDGAVEGSCGSSRDAPLDPNRTVQSGGHGSRERPGSKDRSP